MLKAEQYEEIRCRWFAPDFTHKFLIAEEMRCTPARRCAAIIGMPIGLTRNAMVRRIRPFFTEYVTRTNMPRIPTIPLTSRRKNAEKEISPIQTRVNRSMTQMIGTENILKISFMGLPPLFVPPL